MVAEGGANQSAGCSACMQFDKASVLMMRGDLTYYKDDFAGSHEFELGFFLLRNTYNRTQEYLNGGFIVESHAFNDPNDPSAGTSPFHRQYVTSDLTGSVIADGEDADSGFYLQDTWTPTERLTATLGVRIDLIKREDVRRGFEYQSSTEIGPRLGVSYLLTEDARNVLRASYTRQHEQLQGGRHPVASFGGEPGASFRDEYDVDGDGSFSSVIITPPVQDDTTREQFGELSQPRIDELIVGYRRQFPGQVSMDVAGVFRRISNMLGRVDINGIYPDGPRQPFIGFGLVDPNAGRIEQVRNNDWSQIHYRALQVTIAKSMSRGFSAMAVIHKQWQHLSGTWNPTDRAGFIQPDAFPDNRLLFRTRGPADHNTLPGSTNANMWFPYSIRLAGVWHAPYGLQLSGNWSMIKPSWSGPIVDRLSRNDPDIAVFGPSTVTSVTGVRQSNPLSRRERYRFPTRGEGQELLPLVHQVGLRLTKQFSLGENRSLHMTGAVLNLFNGGNGLEFARGGANRSYSGPTIFLQPGNLQPPRSFQLAGEIRF